MTAQVASLAAKLEAIRDDHPPTDAEQKPTAKKPRSLLPSAPPTAEAERSEIATWVTAALHLNRDPVERAERYGRHEDARMVLVLASGQRVTFERTADAFDARRLVRVVMTATGAQMPPYGYADGLQVAGAIIRLAELLDDDDARHEAAEWARSFLEAAERNVTSIPETGTAAGRWRALSVLCEWRTPSDLPPYAAPAERAAVVLDEQTGARLVRTSDIAAHVRSLIGRPLSWPALHARMVEIGWEHHGQVEQRQPKGDGRRKAHLYAVPAGWDAE